MHAANLHLLALNYSTVQYACVCVCVCVCVCTSRPLLPSLQSLRDSLWKAKDEAAEGAKVWQTQLKEAHHNTEVVLTGPLPTVLTAHTASLNPLVLTAHTASLNPLVLTAHTASLNPLVLTAHTASLNPLVCACNCCTSQTLPSYNYKTCVVE